MPADLGSASWSEIDASNNAVPPNGWPEGMAPSDVNNSARSQMGGEKRWWDRSNSTQTTTGTLTAYVLTYASTEAALYDGEETSFVLHATCGATPTLNRDGLGAKFLRRYDFATNAFIAVAAGDFRVNQVLCVRYNLSADRYDVIGEAGWHGEFVSLSSNNIFTGTNQFNNTVTMSGAAFNEAKGANIASAATTDIGAATGNFVHITGSVAITALGTAQAGTRRIVVFDNTPLITYNPASLILPSAASITAQAGDTAIFESEGAGSWRCVVYQRGTGTPLRVNRAYAEYTTYASLTATIPSDDSIPQIGEGNLILTAAITPQSTANRIRARVQVPLGLGSGGSSENACVALFRNGGTDAIDSTFIRLIDGSSPYPAVLEFEDVPGAITAQTYTVRVGANTQFVNVNGTAGGRLGGGSSRATIVLEEIPV